MITKPMLAVATDGTDLRYPLLLSPKLDGIRAFVMDGVVLSRSLKPIPNKHVQKTFGRHEYNGLDGELIVGPPAAKDSFNRTSSGVMTKAGEPAVSFWVFDDFLLDRGFQHRYTRASMRIHDAVNPRLKLVNHRKVETESDLFWMEQNHLKSGYEGVMLRHLDGPYKFGRSTLKEGWLMKMKRFKDGEAMVVGAYELMHNGNEAERNELGQLERSTKKAGMVGKKTLGGLSVRDLKTGVYFDIGTGFDTPLRAQLWKWFDMDMQNGLGWIPNIEKTLRENPGCGRLLGKIVKYKYQEVGVKDKPRFPVFLGFRDAIDL